MSSTTAGSEKTGGGGRTCVRVTDSPRRLAKSTARRAARVPARHRGAGEPGAPLRDRAGLSVRTALAPARAGGRRAAGAFRGAPLLVAVAPDRVLQLPGGAAAAPVGALAGGAGRPGSAPAPHGAARRRGRRAVPSAPLRVPALRSGGAGRLARARAPAARPPLDAPRRGPGARLPRHEPRGAPGDGRLDAADARPLRAPRQRPARPAGRA